MRIHSLLLVITLLILPVVALAQPTPAPPSGPGPLDSLMPPPATITLPNGTTVTCDIPAGQVHFACIPYAIAHLIRFMLGLVGIFFIINIMIAGYQIAIGSIPGIGSDKNKGKERLIWSLIGFTVSVCAYLILNIVAGLFADK